MDYFNDMWNMIPTDAKTVLDVGAGWGIAGILLKSNGAMGHKIERIDAIDGWKPMLDNLPKAYDNKFHGDIECVLLEMIMRGVKYDVVICTHVLEHLPGNRVLHIMSLMERVATMRVILASPNRFHTNDLSEWGDNPMGQHLCLFASRDARAHGYKVRGTGRIFSFGVGFVKTKLHRFFTDWIGYKDMTTTRGK